jgi:hypothetical protein
MMRLLAYTVSAPQYPKSFLNLNAFVRTPGPRDKGLREGRCDVFTAFNKNHKNSFKVSKMAGSKTRSNSPGPQCSKFKLNFSPDTEGKGGVIVHFTVTDNLSRCSSYRKAPRDLCSDGPGALNNDGHRGLNLNCD